MLAQEYYSNVNPDLLRWIPWDARRVLELGCGEAALAAVYRRRNPNVEYVAVETHAPSAAVAKAYVDLLIEADFTALTDEELTGLGKFDVIVLGDVLEHLPDPWAALDALVGLLTPEGQIVFSVPNVSHWTAIAHLIQGSWPSEDSGLFDRTHLRFFTLTSLQKMLVQSGLKLDRVFPRIFPPKPQDERWLAVLAGAAAQVGVTKEVFLKQAQTLQYVGTSTRQGLPPRPMLHLHFCALAPDYLDVRTRLPLSALESELGLKITYAERSLALPDAPRDARKILIVQRLASREEAGLRQFVNQARLQGWLVVYEIDDHPDLIGRVHAGTAVEAAMRVSVSYNFHAVQTSTNLLAEALSQSNPEVAAFGNCVFDLPPFKPRLGVRKVFYGALNREGFSSKIAAALESLLQSDPDIDFEVVHDRAFFDALPTSRKRFSPLLPYRDYLELMASCDVVLSPLEGLGGEAYKSDIKFLEASRAGAVMIASPAVYAATIRDGTTGFIAHEPEDWAACLSRLIAEPDLRNQVARAAWAYVKTERMMSQQVAERRAWYLSLYDRKAELDAALIARWAAKPLV